MLDRLIRWSLQNRLVVLFAAAVLLALGAWAAVSTPVDVFPDLTAPTVTVLTEAHGMAAEEVESLVTFPVETAVNGASGVRRVRSASSQGISIVWVEFDWGTDIFRARQVVSEKLQLVGAGLPAGVEPPVLAPVTSIMGEVLLVGLTSEAHTPMEVRAAADWQVRRRLLAVPGVSQVVPIGGAVKAYQVLVDPAALQGYDVTLGEVVEAAAASNLNAAGGVYQESGREVLIRGIGRAQDVGDIARTVVATRGGVPVLLGDVARVEVGPQPRYGTASVDAEPAVILSIQKQPGANTLDLTERIAAELDAIQTQLPDGMEVNPALFQQAGFIEVAVDNVVEALRDGAVLVVVVLFLFLWNVRTTFISVLAIPLSLAAALLVMKGLGATINTMTLGGLAIAIGALVDDAIIDVENVFRRLRENRQRPEGERHPALAVIYQASKEVRAPILNATLIITVVFLPLFFLSGVEGRMLRPLGFAYVVSIMASLFVAVTVTPVLCSFLLPDTAAVGRERESWLVEKLQGRYRRTLDWVLGHTRAVLVGAAALAVVALAAFPLLGRGFLPEFQEGTLVISAVTVPGTGIEESDRIGRQAEEILLAHPAVAGTSRRTGRAELDEHAQGANAAEIDVRLDLSGHEMDAVLDDLRDALAVLPGTNITIGQPIGHRIDHMLSGTRASIAVKVFGPDLYELRRVAEGVRAAVEPVEGVVDLAVEQQADVPQLRVYADRARMAGYGVTPAALGEAIDVAFAGEAVSQVREGQEAYDLVVRFADDARGDAEAVRAALIDTPLGPRVRLDQLADVRSERGPNTITRENVQRKLVVSANVAGRDVGSVVDEMREAVAAGVDVPEGYFVEYGGQFESAQSATRTIALLSVLSLALIFLLLYQQFGSARTALLLLVNLPLALTGGVFALLLTGGELNVAALVGFVTLFGIAVRNGILLVSHYQQLLAEGAPFREALVRGSLERLNPILMTALTAGLALIPLALGGGEPGKEIQTPMAVVILGGLLTSTVLNMAVVPALFARFSGRDRLRPEPGAGAFGDGLAGAPVAAVRPVEPAHP
ncbi:efflux RND transporter permease subunit [Rubrivirga marina]|uniref:Multidrug transporter AcrB n=1 Tax=Rubrivirga marina TaxID=1196024 RepID=A0A271ITN6_9BACT|nr:efflux RND transporter permease subunit [Rubrivirga marina]PAP74573.1 multidrug transporter AcrB [Rubrivirga marina]